MTDLEKSLHDVLHSLSAAMKATEEEKKAAEGQDIALFLFYQSLRMELGEFQGRIGKLLRIIEKEKKNDGER